MFATHFHELTLLADRIGGVVNRHVAVDTSHDEILMLYRVIDGVCDKSFGVQVAKSASFPESVVQVCSV